jgi:peptidoglycan hydrolase-like protein with peptidoglycan-binding domain
MTTYPYGYGTGRYTMEDLRARYGENASIPMHPAFAEALFAAIEALNGQLGIGGGYRYTQPVKPGFAPPGRSFHERQNFASGFSGYSAVDTVWTNSGGVHRSPTWAEIEAVKDFGLHAFISGEPWHVQAKNIRGYGSWLNAGRPDPDPGVVVVPPPQPPPDFPPNTDYRPPNDWWLFPLDTGKPTKRNGDMDSGYPGHVRYLQDVIFHYAGGDITQDGDFGPMTQGRVMDVQRRFGLGVDGICGPNTWAALDSLVHSAANPEPLPPDVPTAPGSWAVSPCLYWVRPGDSPWAVGDRVFGSGRAGAELLGPELFVEPNVHIEIPNVKGRGTKVASGEGPWAIVERLGYPNPAGALDAFYDWNGGEGRALHPGDLVHMPSVV